MYFPLLFAVSPHRSVSFFLVSVIEISHFLLEEFVQLSLQFYAIIELLKRSKANEIEENPTAPNLESMENAYSK